MNTRVFVLPPGYTPDARRSLFQCGANAGMTRMQRARITKKIRADTRTLNLRGMPITVPVKILAVQHPGLAGRPCDAENIAPQVKAMIDGLRDARILRDDSPAYVTKVEYTVGERRRGSQLVLHITEITDEPEREAA